MPQVYVYEEFSSGLPELMGILYSDVLRGRERISFEFDRGWLKRTGMKYYIDPDLGLFPGRQYPAGKDMFGLFADSSPDRWGRTLMDRRERFAADCEKPGRQLVDRQISIPQGRLRRGSLGENDV